MFAASGAVSAQSLTDANGVNLQDYQYKKEASGGLRIQTNGVTVFAEYGWIKDLYKTRLLQIEYTYYIDYRWKRQKSLLQDGQGYIFGLQNKFHTIRLSYGIKRTIADKAKTKGVRVSFIAFGGISLGLLKPYYLNLVQPYDGQSTSKPEKYSDANASRFLSKDSILEAAPLYYGLNQMKPVPGLHIKLGLDFDWGNKDEFVKSLEAGVALDLYYRRLPIMINNYNRFYQPSLFLSFQFGKRW